MALERLSKSLWEERVALERMLFKLEEEHLVLASGIHHWLPAATAEVEEALIVLDSVERDRVVASAEAAVALSLRANATLGEIAGATEGQWAEIFEDHRSTMRALLARIGDLVRRNRELLARGLAATADALTLLGQAPVSYDPNGQTPKVRGSAVMIDARA